MTRPALPGAPVALALLFTLAPTSAVGTTLYYTEIATGRTVRFAVVLCHLALGPNREAGNPIRDMVDVLLPQVYRAAELGYVDLDRLAITGQSYGGYGTADMAYHDAGKLFTALRRLRKPAQLASYLDQGHVIHLWRRASAVDAARRMVEFFRRHLGGQDPVS